MVFTLMLTSKGVAGVPRATLVVLLATASTFRLPTEPIFLILGVDAFADMGRTAYGAHGSERDRQLPGGGDCGAERG
jgi:proton glutamate symport protein